MGVRQIYEKIRDKLQLDRNLYKQIYSILSNQVNKIFMDSVKSDEGYCYRFKIPEIDVNKLYKLLELDSKEVLKAFEKDWNKVTMSNRMHSDTYYLILLLLLAYGIKNKDENLAKNALILLLIKIWNGRKARYLKYCDPKIMNYVRDVMMSNKFIIKKYDHPFFLIKDYFVPTLLDKYGRIIETSDPGDPSGLKKIFEQGYSRIRQVFAFDFRTDLKTGQRIAGSGILPLYKKAKEEGLYLGAMKSQQSDEEGDNKFDDFGNVHERDKLVNDILNYIVMNANPSYPDAFVRQVSRVYKTNVNQNVIKEILTRMHNYKFNDKIRDLLVLIFDRTGIYSKDKICSSEFFLALRRKIISSKNNQEVNKIYKIAKEIVDEILQDSIQRKLDDFSAPHVLQITNVLIYGLFYNIRKKVCNQNLR